MSNKLVLTIQDISCVGQCSLTVALPIISACGLETAILPSAVLSNHTGGFKSWTFRDLTDDMPLIEQKWLEEGISFDAIYTGYLGSARQIDIVKHIFETCSKPGCVHVVDPAMADNGSLYYGFDMDFVKEMAKLCAAADYILPNVTEASLITGMEYKETYDEAYVLELAQKLAALGPRSVILTGISYEPSTTGVVIYEDGKKLSVTAPELLPDIVILEPSTLKNVPDYTRKATMLDALCHAVESHWAKKATPESKAFAEKAIELVKEHKDAYLANEDAGNAGMMEAANLAGQAINITTTTAAHAMCYKITSKYGFQHGHAAAICLPEVWKYIEDDSGITRDEFIQLITELGMEYPVSSTPEEDIAELAASVNLQRLSNSPVAFDADQLSDMYRNIIRKG